MARLTGNIQDVTGRVPESISSVTVKAPTFRLGSGSGIVTSSPAQVDFDRSTGRVDINGIEPGLSWLYIEGEGWSDSIALAVADGFTTIVEAALNALSEMDFFKNLLKGTAEINDATVLSLVMRTANSATRNELEASFSKVGHTHSTGEIDGLLALIGSQIVDSTQSSGAIEAYVQQAVEEQAAPIIEAQVGDKLPNQGRIWTGRSGISSADDAPVGWMGVWEHQDATALGLPYAGQGVLVTLPNNNHSVQIFYTYQQGTVNPTQRTVRVFTRYKDSAGWSEWEEDSARLTAAMWGPREVVDMSRAQPGRVAVQSLDELPNGQFALLNNQVADLIGAPLRGQGLVTSWSLGTHTYQRAEISAGSDGSRVVRVFTRYRDSAGWGEWEESGRAAQATPYVSPPPAGFRVAPLALTLGNGGGRAPKTGSFRIPVTYAPAISRWRLRVSSRQPRSGETSGGEYRVKKIAIGPRGGGGSYTAAPTIVAENITVPANGDAAATPWMNTDIGSGQDLILGFEYETINGEAPWTLTGGSWDVGTSAADAQSPSSSTGKGWAPLDWWIEAEVPATTPVIAALGDSLTCGVGAGLPIYDSWLSKYCREHSALPMHLSASGDSAHMSIPTPRAYKLTRWHHLHRPDALIWAMGSNDFMNGHSANATQALVEEAVASILPNESINLYATTILPRAAGQYTASQDAERGAFNDWIKGERNLFRDVFDFASVVDDGTGVLKAEYDSDGIHLLSAGYTALADAITRPVVPPKA